MTHAEAAPVVRTTCPYCGVGCGILAQPRPDGTVSIAGDPEHPANRGRLCSKGAALGETLSLDGRLLRPEIDGVPVGWDEALDVVAKRFADAIAQHGPGSVAVYGSGQLLTEDYYVANKLMKGFVGSANIDTNSRLCMASSVAGHKRAFGSDTVPGNYDDLDAADLILLVGSNLAWCHPVLFQRISEAKAARPAMRVVLIDPRRTAAAELADLHLPVSADGDSAVFVGLLAHLAHRGAVSDSYVAAHTTGVGAALAEAENWSTDQVCAATGLDADQLAVFYEWFEATERVVTIFSQGVNQSAAGTDKVNAIINAHLLTGRIGRPGMGPFSVTGQPNAMGGREVGGLANMLAAHMDFTPEAIDRVGRFWGSGRVATTPGLRAVEMFAAVGRGEIKAIWIMGTNPVVSMPDADAVKAALATCPFVVVSDMTALTDTAALAHVRLPAAPWGEKDGTVTNSERRISRQRAFLASAGEARPDWWIISQVASRMGFASAFAYGSPRDIFAEHVALSGFENSGSRDFDLSGLADADYDALEPTQWPVRDGPTARLFADGRFFTADGKARFVPVVPPAPLWRTPGRLTLNTGRVRDHWHTMTRTGKAARLSAHYGEPFVEIHPEDARARGIARNALVRLSNPLGSVLLRALVTERQQPGNVFAPMHWTDQFASSGRVDTLVPSRVDPYSAQPALKMAAVEAEPFNVSHYGFFVSTARPSLDTAYWAVARATGGFRGELAWSVEPPDWSKWISEAFDLPEGAETIRYIDERSGRRNFAVLSQGRLVFALYVSRDPVLVARQWAVELLQVSGLSATGVVAGRPGGGTTDAGAIVCACHAVGQNTIIEAARTKGCHTVAAIGIATRAGTNCGACRAEIGVLLEKELGAKSMPV